MPNISLVMPCHNRAHDLQRVLRAYDLQDLGESFELIAVDDASSDATYDLLNSYHPNKFELRVEHFETNQGPAAARNKGISVATNPIILFVGDDILPAANLVRGHLTAHRRYKDKETAVLGRVMWPKDMPVNTLMKHIDGIGAEQFSYHYLEDGQEYDFRHLYTANVSLKRDFIQEQEKWFDTKFRFAALEDAEFAFRLSKSGLKIIYSSVLLGYHYHYHNIWTFSQRQYLTGLMACVFIKKYPDTTHKIIGKRWPYQAYFWRMISMVKASSPQNAEWLENEVKHLLSVYEWMPSSLLDILYLKALNYFFYKGLIYGTFGDGNISRRVNAVYAHRVLVPLLKWFIKENKRLMEPFPNEHGPWILNRLDTQKNMI